MMVEVDTSYRLSCFKDLSGKSALISGASRGIGRAVALKLAALNCNVAICAKTISPQPTLPGTIYSVAEECLKLNPKIKAIPIQIDMREEKSLEKCVEICVKEFGKIDILINNASALWWQDILDTPIKRMDLIFQINARGTFILTKLCLKYMQNNKFGRIINMSPPLPVNYTSSRSFHNKKKYFAGKTAYSISKLGMTMVALGAHEEVNLNPKFEDVDLTANCLWPATVIESSASENFQLADKKFWRKAEIIADCTVGIVCEGREVSGNTFIDEDYLRQRWNFKDDDFIRYRCDKDFEPPRLLAPEITDDEDNSDGTFKVKRGSVTRLEQDKKKSML